MDRKRQWKQLLEEHEKRQWERQLKEQQYGGENMPVWAHWLAIAGIILLTVLGVAIVL